ncbi:MAG: AhpC/TSA family protein [Flavobacteriaceae bacterium]|nr:AhpC/TSA family protein [Flavobacteriaceae bacterium]
MKKIIYIFVLLAIIACKKDGNSKNGAPEGGYLLSIKAPNMTDNSKVYLSRISESNKIETIDTIQIVNGVGEFKGTVNQIDIHLISIDGQQAKMPFIIANESIELTIDNNDLSASTIVDKTGSTNKGYNEYKIMSNPFDQRAKSLNERAKEAQQNQDAETFNLLRVEFQALQNEQVGVEREFIKTHLNDISGVLLLDKNLRYQSMPLDEIFGYYNQMNDELKSLVAAKNLAAEYKKSQLTKIGVKAADFTGNTPEGKQVSLSSVTAKGKVTIVDFWASWCRPCRMENPNVVRLYNEYHSKGLEIIGVSLDKTAPAWEKAIADDQLTWTHVSHLQYWNEPIAKQFGITSIPQTLILDENGVIIAKNLRGKELADKLAKLL